MLYGLLLLNSNAFDGNVLSAEKYCTTRNYDGDDDDDVRNDENDD